MSKSTPEYVTKTITILSKVIKTPKLDPKLLARPPIKFQRDIFNSVTKNTGFMKGLFKKNEINDEALRFRMGFEGGLSGHFFGSRKLFQIRPASLKTPFSRSKDKKLEMFVKVITLLEIMTKKELGIDAVKIVAGKEADKTNLMLQLIGRLAGKADAGTSSEKYVKAALKKLAGSSNSEPKPEEEDPAKEKKREREPSKQREGGEKRSSSKPRDEAKTTSRDKRDSSKSRSTPARDRSSSKPREGKTESAPKKQEEDTRKPHETSRSCPANSNKSRETPNSMRPPSANANRRKIQQKADEDEVEIDEGVESHNVSMDQQDAMDALAGHGDPDSEMRPVTSRGSRPTTSKGGRSRPGFERDNTTLVNDQFLVETRIMDENDAHGADQLNLDDQNNHGLLVNNMLKMRNQTDENNFEQEITYTPQEIKEFSSQRDKLIQTRDHLVKISEPIEQLNKITQYSTEDSDQLNKEMKNYRLQVIEAERKLTHNLRFGDLGFGVQKLVIF